MLGDSSISFAIEMYCHSAEEFRYVFYKCLKELNSMHKTVSDYYNEHPDGGETVSEPLTVGRIPLPLVRSLSLTRIVKAILLLPMEAKYTVAEPNISNLKFI